MWSRNDPVEKMIEYLDLEFDLVVSGKINKLIEVGDKRNQLSRTISAVYPRECDLVELRQKLERNGRVLYAAVHALREVSTRIQNVCTGDVRFESYTQAGGTRPIGLSKNEFIKKV